MGDFGTSLQQGYAVGSAWRDRRLKEGALAESYGTKNVQNAYAQEMLRERTQQDMNILAQIGQHDPEAFARGVNAHPLLGPAYGPIQYHPEQKIMTDGFGGVFTVDVGKDGKPIVYRTQAVPLSLIRSMKKGDKVTVEYEHPRTGAKFKGPVEALFEDVGGEVRFKFGKQVEVLPDKPKVELTKQQAALKRENDSILAKGGMAGYQALPEEDKEKYNANLAEISSINDKLKEAGVEPEKAPPPATKELDLETAQKLLNEAGGDADKARELAKQQGYIIKPIDNKTRSF